MSLLQSLFFLYERYIPSPLQYVHLTCCCMIPLIHDHDPFTAYDDS